MDMTYFNAFINAMVTTVGVLCQSDDVLKGDLYFSQGSVTSSGVTAFTNIEKAFSGSCIIDIDPESAAKLSARMMHTETVTEREIIESCIGEIANQVGGAAISAIMDSGVEISISTPMIIFGKDTAVSFFSGEKILFMPLQCGDIKLQTGLFIKDTG